ncbi:DNA translocase FtsK [Eubacteriales bacterium OttesenSCG-928-G02]|nr:DNA translocase FtsK [Eubacteriales bacterium OttesenSCG-928-G02]
MAKSSGNPNKKKPPVKSTAKTAQKPAPKKTSKSNKAAEEAVVKQSNGVLRVVMPYLFVVFAVFIIFTFFLSDTGWLGSAIKPFLFGLFGGGAYVIPFYLLLCAIMWKRDLSNKMNGGKIILSVINFIFILTIIHLLTMEIDDRTFSHPDDVFIKIFYKKGGELIGAGAIGGTIACAFEKLFGYIFTLILSFITSFITLIFLFGSTPMKMIKKFIEAFKTIQIEDDEEELLDEPEPDFTPSKKPTKPEKPAKTRASVVIEDVVPINDAPISTNFDEEPVKDISEFQPIESLEPVKPDEPEDYKSIFSEKDSDEEPLVEWNMPDEADITLTPESAEEPAELVIETSAVENEPSMQYIFPPLSLLAEGAGGFTRPSNIAETGQKLINVLASYGVESTLVSTSCGPTVTRYEIQPAEGVRVSRISSLSDDIRLRLAAPSIRIESNISGKAALGIEIPNDKVSLVFLRDLIDTNAFRNHKSNLYVCLGMDISGSPVYFDIPDMPHLLIAGATGMGKSVCINSIIISLLYRANPNDVKFIFIDPKKVELSIYNGIPHLLIPVVTDPLKAAGSLNWAVVEMERRYSLMEDIGGVRNIGEYNDIIEGDEEREKLPEIVIIIDELADLMMSASKEVESSICRLAQKARAAGIYLIIGTQRPSVDVVTGLIKANIPSRIAFTVSSGTDSRTILDSVGAEDLLGRGDMLYAPVKALKAIRVQGAYVDGQKEVAAVCNFIKSAAMVSYDENIIKIIEQESKMCGVKPSKQGRASDGNAAEDPLFLDAIDVVLEFETASTSLLQRRLSIGYSKAQKIIDMMEDKGYVGKYEPSTKKRKINITREEYMELKLSRENEN